MLLGFFEVANLILEAVRIATCGVVLAANLVDTAESLTGTLMGGASGRLRFMFFLRLTARS